MQALHINSTLDLIKGNENYFSLNVHAKFLQLATDNCLICSDLSWVLMLKSLSDGVRFVKAAQCSIKSCASASFLCNFPISHNFSSVDSTVYCAELHDFTFLVNF